LEKTKDSGEIDLTVNLPIKEGDGNYIKWRAMDVAGNGYTESEDLRIRINTLPKVIITSPVDGSEYTTKDEINFNALQTFDVDGDKLNLYWQSNISGSVGTGFLFSSKIFPGYHQITLYANDGNGHNVTAAVNISVIDMDKDTDNDGIPDALDTDDDNDGLLDVDEHSTGTNPLDSDTDGDNVDDGIDMFPLNSREWDDTDGDNIGNNADLDDDQDGYPDSIDSDPLDPSKHEDISDTDMNLIYFIIGLAILVVLIIAVFFYIRNKKTEEDNMEMEMVGIMPGTSSLPPSATIQAPSQYLPQQQVNVYGLQPSMQQVQQPYGATPQYQLPPVQTQDQYATQGYVQAPQQINSYQLPPADLTQPSPYRQELDVLENQMSMGLITQEQYVYMKNELDNKYPGQQ
jgi:hypothetical protein